MFTMFTILLWVIIVLLLIAIFLLTAIFKTVDYFCEFMDGKWLYNPNDEIRKQFEDGLKYSSESKDQGKN